MKHGYIIIKWHYGINLSLTKLDIIKKIAYHMSKKLTLMTNSKNYQTMDEMKNIKSWF